MYNRKIICDIDDTISFTTSRDWDNARPNIELIKKLNELYDNGWIIEYYTARGSLSFNNRSEAKKYYEPIIKNWFKKYNVKYHTLSFNKPLGIYYIDDKGIKPDDFLNLDIEILNGGLSGAIIERHGNRVYKTHKNSLNSVKWYNIAKNYIKTPKVYSIIGDTLCIDYIEKTDAPKIYQIDYIIDIFKNIPSYIDFESYYKRIADHLKLYNPKYTNIILNKLKENENFFNDNKSFCHGDFSIDNMINSNDTLYLIDPIFESELYSSWLLDISKLLQSSKRFNNFEIYNYYINKYNNIKNQLLLLELTHWIRMRKYSENKKIVDDNIKELLNVI